MSGKTSIEWTDMSSNPLRAYHVETGKRGWFCVHASAGCTNCYAERRNKWIGNKLAYTAQNLKNVRFEMHEPELRSWQRLAPGTKVFAFDMTDLFQDGVPDELIDRAFAAIVLSRATFQILTKRADRMRRYLDDPFAPTRIAVHAVKMAGPPLAMVVVSELVLWGGAEKGGYFPMGLSRWPLPNVWLGTSVEDQATADSRIPPLLQTPAAVRFVSYEPALGPVDFRRSLLNVWACNKCGQAGGLATAAERTRGHLHAGCAYLAAVLPGLDWLIVGLESGHGARPGELGWIRSAVAQCEAAGVAPFVKQLGSSWARAFNTGRDRKLQAMADSKGGDMDFWPKDLRVRQFPRSA